MTVKRIKNLILTVGLLLGSLVGVGSVLATDYDGLDSVMTISPPKQKIVLTPGEDYEGQITVSSMSSAKNDLVYSVTVGSFSLGKDENGNVDYNDTDVDTVTSYNQMMDWIELKKDKGTVAKGESSVIPFVIHVPENAPAGGQYATIIVQDDTMPEDSAEGSISIISKIRFASSIFAEVTGDTDEKGTIQENNIPGFLLNNQLTASSLVKNEGNIHTDAEYTFQVWPLFGDEEICTNEEKEEGSKVEGSKTSLIMPGTERYHTQTCYLPSVGIYRAVQTVKIFGETSVVEKTVIACPLWLLFVILFIIFAIIFAIVKKVHGKKRSKDSE